MGFLNTLVLITSSLTMALGIYFIQVGQKQKAIWNLVITLLWARLLWWWSILSILIKFMKDSSWKVFPSCCWAHQFGIVFFLYYLMTGLHGTHVLIGMGLITLVLIRTILWGFWPCEYFTPVEGVLGIFGISWFNLDPTFSQCFIWSDKKEGVYMANNHEQHHIAPLRYIKVLRLWLYWPWSLLRFHASILVHCQCSCGILVATVKAVFSDALLYAFEAWFNDQPVILDLVFFSLSCYFSFRFWIFGRILPTGMCFEVQCLSCTRISRSLGSSFCFTDRFRRHVALGFQHEAGFQSAPCLFFGPLPQLWKFGIESRLKRVNWSKMPRTAKRPGASGKIRRSLQPLTILGISFIVAGLELFITNHRDGSLCGIGLCSFVQWFLYDVVEEKMGFPGQFPEPVTWCHRNQISGTWMVHPFLWDVLLANASLWVLVRIYRLAWWTQHYLPWNKSLLYYIGVFTFGYIALTVSVDLSSCLCSICFKVLQEFWRFFKSNEKNVGSPSFMWTNFSLLIFCFVPVMIMGFLAFSS